MRDTFAELAGEIHPQGAELVEDRFDDWADRVDRGEPVLTPVVGGADGSTQEFGAPDPGQILDVLKVIATIAALFKPIYEICSVVTRPKPASIEVAIRDCLIREGMSPPRADHLATKYAARLAKEAPRRAR